MQLLTILKCSLRWDKRWTPQMQFVKIHHVWMKANGLNQRVIDSIQCQSLARWQLLWLPASHAERQKWKHNKKGGGNLQDVFIKTTKQSLSTSQCGKIMFSVTIFVPITEYWHLIFCIIPYFWKICFIFLLGAQTCNNCGSTMIGSDFKTSCHALLVSFSRCQKSSQPLMHGQITSEDVLGGGGVK